MFDVGAIGRLTGGFLSPVPYPRPIARAASIDPLWPQETAPDRREQSDDYSRVVVLLNDRFRVIACKDGIQWILQKRRRDSHVWDGVSYCRTQSALARCIREKVEGEIDPQSASVIAALPAIIEGGADVR